MHGAGALLAEGCRFRLERALRLSEDRAASLLRVVAAAGLNCTADVADSWTRCSVVAERAGCWRNVVGVTRLVELLLRRLDLLLRDQVVDALFVFHLFVI